MKQACDLLFAKLTSSQDLKSSWYVFIIMNKPKSSAVTCKVCFGSVSNFPKCPQVKLTLPDDPRLASSVFKLVLQISTYVPADLK